jgi:dihydrofolate reductase
MNLIVAVDENWAIGKEGDLLEKISEDLKRFKELTTNNIVVMGRVTFDSLPKKRPLPNRKNIVLTRDKTLVIEGVEICYTVDELLKMIEKEEKDVFVMGGEKIYKLLLPFCKKAYVTKIYNSYDADRYMENLDISEEWEEKIKEEIRENDNGIKYQYITYEKKSGY